jgi:hypothetical protein
MANKYDSDEPEIYFDEEFDYGNHKQTFDRTVDDLSDFINGCARSRRIRTCEWDGQNEDLTKSGDNAFPFRAPQTLSNGYLRTLCPRQRQSIAMPYDAQKYRHTHAKLPTSNAPRKCRFFEVFARCWD